MKEVVTQYSKYNGLGNDFLVRLLQSEDDLTSSDDVRRLCDRRYGFGADGVIETFVKELGGAYMHLVNSDGSIAEMSGNGVRCLIHHLVRVRAMEAKDAVTLDTLAGPRRVQALGFVAPQVLLSSVEMPRAKVTAQEVLGVKGYLVDVGNPHFVIECKDISELRSQPLSKIGPELEGAFEGGANIEWVYLESHSKVHLRVWERGAGETLACGTGSVASYTALSEVAALDKRVEILNPGGSLWVSGGDGLSDAETLWLEGPSVYVGDIYAPDSSVGHL